MINKQHYKYNIVVTSHVIWALRRLPVKIVDIHVYTSDSCIYKWRIFHDYKWIIYNHVVCKSTTVYVILLEVYKNVIFGWTHLSH